MMYKIGIVKIFACDGKSKMASQSVTKKELFISYGREPEVVPFVQKLKVDLTALGFSVWLDINDIHSGDDWYGAIGTGLDNCRAVLTVITKKYIHSRYCTSELYTANSDGKLIFPLMYADINFSETERSRGVKYVVGGCNWTMFRPGKDDYQTSFDKLVRGLQDQGFHQDGLDGLQQGMANVTLNSGFSDLPPSYAESVNGTAKPQPVKAKKSFEVNMRLEAVDRKFPWFVCAAHVEEVKPAEGKLKVHFDGWTCKYDYWTDVGTVDLHPVGWCERNGWELQKPGSASGGSGFRWDNYLTFNNFIAAPDDCFVPCQLAGLGNLKFAPEMYLEIEQGDKVHVGKVLEVQEPINGDLSIQLLDTLNVIKLKKSSPNLHPAMWASKNGKQQQLVKPNAGFRWSEFLGGQAKIPAPAFIFSPEQRSLPGDAELPGTPANMLLNQPPPNLFEDDPFQFQPPVGNLLNFGGLQPLQQAVQMPPVGNLLNLGRPQPLQQAVQQPLQLAVQQPLQLAVQQPLQQAVQRECEEDIGVGGFILGRKLEAKDLKNPGLICVASITDVRENTSEINIHFDGWSNMYDYWCQIDFKEIHPIGWCMQKRIVLQKPNGYGNAFDWDSYLAETDTEAVPRNCFTLQQKS